MKYSGLCAVLIACFFLIPSHSASGQSPFPGSSLVLYDDFNGPRINPAKWSDFSQLQGSTETVRELAPPYQGQGNNGRLHLMQQAYSWPWNDSGETWGWVGFSFASTAPIKDVSFSLSVNNAIAAQCQTDPENPTSTWAGYSGRYFNYGDGSKPEEDVSVNIQVQRDNTNPTGPLNVQAIVSTGGSSGFWNLQILGTVKLGQSANLRVRWDKPNKQFVFQMNGNPAVFIDYFDLPDSSAPYYLFKGLSIGHGVSNCTTQPTGRALMDAYFDNVYIGVQ